MLLVVLVFLVALVWLVGWIGVGVGGVGGVFDGVVVGVLLVLVLVLLILLVLLVLLVLLRLSVWLVMLVLMALLVLVVLLVQHPQPIDMARRNARSDPPPLACKGARRARSLSSSSGFLALAWSSCHNLGPELFLYPSWGPPHRPAHAARPHLLDRIFRLSGRFSRIFCIFAVCQKTILKTNPQFSYFGCCFQYFLYFSE